MTTGFFRCCSVLATSLALVSASLVIYVLMTDSTFFSFQLQPVRSQVITGDGYFTVPLHPGRSATYVTAKIGNGTPDSRDVHLLIDSGSDHFWVRERLLPSDTKLSLQRFSVEYAGGDASGVHGEAEFSLGSIQWAQSIGVVDSTTSQLQEVQSVMGVSRKCRDKRLCVLPQWRLRESVLSFIYDLKNGQGNFLAGHLDEKVCKTPLNWLHVADSFYWNTEATLLANGVRLGDRPVRAVWDTGTSFLYLSPKLYEAVMSILPRKDELCNLGNLPTLEFEFNEQRYSLPGHIYASRNIDKTCSYQLGLLENRWVEIIGADMLIGWVFLQAHYVAFHIEKDQIGICSHQDLQNSQFRSFRVSSPQLF